MRQFFVFRKINNLMLFLCCYQSLLISGMFYTTKFDKIGLFLPKYLYGKQYKKAPFAAYVNPENPELLYALAPGMAGDKP